MFKFIIYSIFCTSMLTLRGAYSGIWIMWPIAFLLAPGWHFSYVGSLRFTYIATTAIIGVAALGMFSSNHSLPAAPRKRFALTDLVVALIPVTSVISIMNNTNFNPLSIPSTILPTLPYILGRFYLRRAEDLESALKPMVVACAILAPLVAIESLAGVNPFRAVLDRTLYVSVRQGYGRAIGACTTSHTLGLIMVMTIPWMLEARRRARAGEAPRWWRWAPVFNVVTALGTLSRSPMLALGTTFWIDRFFQRKRQRALILSVTILGIAAGYHFWSDVEWLLHVISGESEALAQKNLVLIINGKEEVYTGSRHRILLYEVYRDHMQSAEFFGHHDRPLVLPPHLEKFWSIDNHYIYTRLIRGWAGLLIQDLLIFLTLYRMGRLGLSSHRFLGPFAGSLFAAVASIGLAMFTVTLTAASLAIFYFMVGVAATIYDLPEPESSHEEWWDGESQWDDMEDEEFVSDEPSE